MSYLPLANIMHHKLRSALSALGIGIGVAMLITLSGLSRGSLYEVADRWESVDADIIVFPRGWGENAADKSGSGISDKIAAKILADHADIVERVVPIFTWPIKLGGQDQMTVGVDPEQWHTLTGGRELIEGRLFDPDNAFSRWILSKLLTPSANGELVEISEADLSAPEHNGLELVVDSRLAKAGKFHVGQCVEAANHKWTIVGVVPSGAMARVFLPRRTSQYLLGSGDIGKSTLMFVKLRPGADVASAVRAISRSTKQDVVPAGRYRGMLVEKFGIMFRYVDAVNGVAMVIAFLFTMITLYTMVLQRTREIAILKSSGASNFFIVRQVLAESLMLTAAGTVAGILLSFAGAKLIETFAPLLTVTITPRWIFIAAAAAMGGAILSAVYPAYRATRVDMLQALTYE
jgi:putative ABC transport system permease protein